MQPQGTLSHDDAEIIFKRLAFKEYHCGDCLLQIALQSDRGVYYYYERVEDAEDDGWGDMLDRITAHAQKKSIASTSAASLPSCHTSQYTLRHDNEFCRISTGITMSLANQTIFRIMEHLHNTKEHFELIEEAMRQSTATGRVPQ